MAMPALELHQLGCERGGRVLFEGVHLPVPEGRLLRVSGANGAGKTSLLRIVCGLLTPSAGQVRWQGAAIGTLREQFRRQLLYLGHASALKDDLDARENLAACARLAGLPADAQAVQAAIEAAGLASHAHLPVGRLSQGQRRRVALTRLLLASGTPLWVLDEPFDALDAAASGWLLALISSQVRRGGVVLLTSHQAELPWPTTLPRMELAL